MEHSEQSVAVVLEAADEIERLRKAWDVSIAERGVLMAEIERLRGGNDELIKTIEVIQRSYQDREALWNDMQERFSGLVTENERLRDLGERLHDFAEAYPLKVFPEPTDEEREWLLESDRTGRQDRRRHGAAHHRGPA